MGWWRRLTSGGVLAEEGSVKMFLRGRPVPMLIPTELAPTYSLDARSELPSSRLKLDWVYPFAVIPSSLPLIPQSGRDQHPSGRGLQRERGSLH